EVRSSRGCRRSWSCRDRARPRRSPLEQWSRSNAPRYSSGRHPIRTANNFRPHGSLISDCPAGWIHRILCRHFFHHPTPETGKSRMGEMIVVRDLVKNYGDFCAVNHVTFTVPEGKIFGFLGPNGAGKTTTIKLLTTVLDPTSGSLRVNGHDPTRERKEVRRSFGIVFQDPSLDDELTAYENMDLHGVLYGVPRAERRQRIDTLVDFVGLSERKN